MTIALLLLAAPDELLARAREAAAANAARLPKYTCVQTVRRVRYDTLTRARRVRCGHVSGPAAGQPAPVLAWISKLRLDVTVSGGEEIFSWAGAPGFVSSDVREVIDDGLASSGDFAQFVASVFGPGASHEPARGATWSYRVPAAASQYRIRLGPRDETVAYEGVVAADPATGALRSLSVIVANPPRRAETCRVETIIEYRDAAAGGATVTLPHRTVVKLWDTDWARHENQIEYSACRTFGSESVLRTDGAVAEADAPSPVPWRAPGAELRIALTRPIDADTAYAGDEIQGRLMHALRARGRELAPVGAAARGRIVRLEQHLLPSPYFLLGLRWETLATHDGPALLDLEPATPQRGLLVPGDLGLWRAGFVTAWRSR